MAKVVVEPIRCQSCGLEVLGRGGDLEGWKAVQPSPDTPCFYWYCMKPICQQTYAMEVAKAQVAWGYVEPSNEPFNAIEPSKAVEIPSDVPELPKPVQPMSLVAHEVDDPEKAGLEDVPFVRLEGGGEASADGKFIRREGTGEK